MLILVRISFAFVTGELERITWGTFNFGTSFFVQTVVNDVLYVVLVLYTKLLKCTMKRAPKMYSLHRVWPNNQVMSALFGGNVFAHSL